MVTAMNRDDTRSLGSRILHLIDRSTSRPAVAGMLLGADALWLVFSSLVGFPSRLEAIFQTLVAAVTLALVFVIQHTQAREQLVTQRKLDEILRALPSTDKAGVGLEEGNDLELEAVHSEHRELRQQATASGAPSGHTGAS